MKERNYIDMLLLSFSIYSQFRFSQFCSEVVDGDKVIILIIVPICNLTNGKTALGKIISVLFNWSGVELCC